MNKKLFAIIILGVFFIGLGSAALTDNIVSYYKLDESSGTTVYDSLGTNNGTNNGATPNVAGKINTAYDFDGSNDYVSFTVLSELSISNDYSISGWFKTDDLTTQQSIFGNSLGGENRIGIMIENGEIRARSYGGVGNDIIVGGNHGKSTGQWMHFVLVHHSDNSMILYLDASSVTGGSEIVTTQSNLRATIGSNVGLGNKFNGVIDEVGIWSRALSSSEVAQLYNSGNGNSLGGENRIGITVSLISPKNNTLFSDIGGNFTTKFTPNDLNLTNATYTLWKQNNSGWDIFNETTISLNGNESVNYTQFIDSFTLGEYKWNVYSCGENSTGFSNCSWAEKNYTFNVGASIIGEEYQNISYESELEHFELNISLLETAVLYDVNFNYNGTNYQATITELDNKTYKLSYDLYIPNIIGNITFCWKIYYDDLGTIKQQELACHDIKILSLPAIELTTGVCSAGLFEAVNFSFNDEGNNSLLNVNMQYNFKYGVDNYTSKLIHGEFNNTNNFRICINSSLGFYKVGTAEIVYEGSSHVNRRFYMYQGQELSNSTTREYKLYDLLTTDSTSFLFEVKNTFLNVYNNKLISLLRWYPADNEYKVVESAITDSDGLTVMKVETEDVDYRIGLYEKNGSLIKIADSVRMACLQDPCTYTMKVIKYDTDYFSTYDVENSLTYDENNKRFLFIWNDKNQKTSKMRLEVFKVAGNQDILICNTSSPGFTGVLSCSTGNYTGTFYAKAYRSASPEKVFKTLYHSITTGIESSFGLFLSAIIVLASGLIGLYSPIAAVILLLISLVPSLALGTINMAIFMGIATLGGIIIHYIKRAK